jgi:hypothetical protein
VFADEVKLHVGDGQFAFLHRWNLCGEGRRVFGYLDKGIRVIRGMRFHGLMLLGIQKQPAR